MAKRRRQVVTGGFLLIVALAIGLATTGLWRRPPPRPAPHPGASEKVVNRYGYHLLARNEVGKAIEVFRRNVAAHPRSANTHDSLGEAYLVAGNRPLALVEYRSALEIDPGKKSARYAVARLAGGGLGYRPLVMVHVVAGLIAIVFGAISLSLRKGSQRHGQAGTVFAVAMLSMSGSATYMAFVDPRGEPINVLMGALTFYLVTTAWLTVRRRPGQTSKLDWAGMLVAVGLSAALAKTGAASMSGPRSGLTGVFFVFSAIALLAASLDLRMILRGGVVGVQRLVRHLWRMCVALFIAATSLFLGQPQLFSYELRRTGLLAVPSILIVSALVYWLVRVGFGASIRSVTGTASTTTRFRHYPGRARQ